MGGGTPTTASPNIFDGLIHTRAALSEMGPGFPPEIRSVWKSRVCFLGRRFCEKLAGCLGSWRPGNNSGALLGEPLRSKLEIQEVEQCPKSVTSN